VANDAVEALRAGKLSCAAWWIASLFKSTHKMRKVQFVKTVAEYA